MDRAAGQTGFCRCPGTALVAKRMLHHWEEPALAGNGGSGAVFFGGCTLGCKYCQNAAISCSPTGTPTDSAGLRRIFEDLIAQGAENIDLVTPTHYLPTILPALTPRLPVPVVYNCGGYERAETIRLLEGKIDIYLPDLKYRDEALASELSGAADYFTAAADAIREKIMFCTDDRKNEGILPLMNVEENLTISVLNQLCKGGVGLLNHKKEKAIVGNYTRDMDIKYAGPQQQVVFLSGGNQQKAIIAREIVQNSKLMIFVQPTRGLDFGAIENIHKQIIAERDKGRAVLLISLELDEIIALADTIGVMYNGEMQTIAPANTLTANQVGEYMMGVKSK